MQSVFRSVLTGGPKPVWLRYLLLIAAASGLTHFALGKQWMRESAVLYVLIPYLVGLLIYLFTPVPSGVGFLAVFGRHMRIALIVMLSTSLLLFEGFLCVMMFLPIYFFFAMLIVFSDTRGVQTRSRKNSDGADGPRFRVTFIPVLVILLSLDGINIAGVSIGPDRMTTVSRTATLDLSPTEIRANIINHHYPASGRSRFLALFPRPISVDAKSLDIGAKHIAQMEYRRWGLAGINVHRGTTVMEFTHSEPTQLRAKFVHDDSYLSHYMRFDQWAMDLNPRADGRTDVTITVSYERKLAPSWYFGPLQKKAVGDGLDYALSDILQPRS